MFRDLRSLGDVSDLRADGYSLIYGKVLIDDYRDRDIDGALLDELTSAFATIRAAGLKVLPRVYYADDAESPDAPLERVLSHIEQLTPLRPSRTSPMGVRSAPRRCSVAARSRASATCQLSPGRDRGLPYRYAVRLANTPSWDDATGTNLLGTQITIGP